MNNNLLWTKRVKNNQNNIKLETFTHKFSPKFKLKNERVQNPKKSINSIIFSSNIYLKSNKTINK